VESGAIVRAYVVEPLCAEAEEQLQRGGGDAGDVRVEAVCLPRVEGGGELKLAVIGANARRATEDSTSIAYLEPPGPGNKFAAPILETAEIAQITSSSGARAMAQLLRAIERASPSGSLRASVAEELQ